MLIFVFNFTIKNNNFFKRMVNSVNKEYYFLNAVLYKQKQILVVYDVHNIK